MTVATESPIESLIGDDLSSLDVTTVEVESGGAERAATLTSAVRIVFVTKPDRGPAGRLLERLWDIRSGEQRRTRYPCYFEALDDSLVQHIGTGATESLTTSLLSLLQVRLSVSGLERIDTRLLQSTPEELPALTAERLVTEAPRQVFVKPQPLWTDAKNERRCELIDMEIAGTLSGTEAAELDLLQREMLTYRRQVGPLPLADLRRLHQDLLRRSRRSPD